MIQMKFIKDFMYTSHKVPLQDDMALYGVSLISWCLLVTKAAARGTWPLNWPRYLCKKNV